MRSLPPTETPVSSVRRLLHTRPFHRPDGSPAHPGEGVAILQSPVAEWAKDGSARFYPRLGECPSGTRVRKRGDNSSAFTYPTDPVPEAGRGSSLTDISWVDPALARAAAGLQILLAGRVPVAAGQKLQR